MKKEIINDAIPDLTKQRLHSIDLMCKIVCDCGTYYFKPNEISSVLYKDIEHDDCGPILIVDTEATTMYIKNMTPEMFFSLVDEEIIRVNKLIAEFQANQMKQQQKFLESPNKPLSSDNGNKPPLKLV